MLYRYIDGERQSIDTEIDMSRGTIDEEEDRMYRYGGLGRND